MIFLKQSTAATIRIGSFVDAVDGGTPETAIALAAGEAYLFKASGAGVDISGLTWAHTFNGMYDLSLTATETDTLGMVTINVRDAAARPVTVNGMVLPANVYDSLFGAEKLEVDINQIGGNAIAGYLSGTTMLNVDALQIDGNPTSAMLSGLTALNADVTFIDGNASSGFLTGTDNLKADTVKISGTAAAADNLEAGANALVTGTVSTGSSATLVTTDLTETTNDHYNGRTLTFTSGNLAGQSTAISDYSGTTKSLTVAALTEAPANTDTFVIS